jgi:ABC-type polar amino acid transport system ATPase subunit
MPSFKLSGGQKQRLAIARTIALNPKIICLEPTSALDPTLTKQVADYISDLAKNNRMILLATHDIGLVKQLKGKLFFMKSGSIVETCSTDDYTINPSNYSLLKTFLN